MHGAWSAAAFGICSVVGGILLLLCTLLLVQVAMAQRRASSGSAAAWATRRPRIAVVMPAHDEAGGITPCIEAVLAQLPSGGRLLVVADNCSDGTAAVARAAGAEVVERTDVQRRGKGYALDFGVRALAAAAPEVVVVVDADCVVHGDALTQLAQACLLSGRPCQALYLMHAPPGAGLKTRLAEFAWVVKNHVRPLGYLRMGLPCQLLGSGMAFPWSVIEAAPLASGHLVEDLQLGLELAAAGSPALFCPQARVTSTFPGSDEGLLAQRTRWEHGYLDVALSLGPRMLWRALASGRVAMGALVLDLCVPPLATLAALLLVTLTAAAGCALWGAALPLLLAGLACIAFAVAVLWAWHGFGRAIASPRDLLSVPFYVAAKLPLYLRGLMRRQSQWVRTKRDDTPK